MIDGLQTLGVTLSAVVRTYTDSERTGEIAQPLADGVTLAIAGAEVRLALATTSGLAGSSQLTLMWTVVAGELPAAAVGLTATWTHWSTEAFVVMPAAVYNGNRYPRSAGIAAADPRDHTTITVSPVPRLHPDGEPATPSEPTRWKSSFPGGPSRIQLLAGDCSTPMIAVQHAGHAVSFVTDQQTVLGQNGLSVSEDASRTQAVMAFMAPGVREAVRYNGRASRDRGAHLRTGDTIQQRIVIDVAPAVDVPALMARVFTLRHALAGHPRWRHELPFAAAFAKQERKYHRENWVEREGYFSVGMRESPPQDWQTGWVGGPNAAYALLVEGDSLSTARAMRCFDFIAREAVTPSGFVKSTYYSETQTWSGTTCYLRYSADTLYFLMKAILLLQKRPPHTVIPPAWLSLARGLCNGFTDQFAREGRFVHHVHATTGATVVGGSCAAGLAPAGLALAAGYFAEPRYLAAATGAAAVYDEQFVQRGITNGGPGDIYQCIDSESCAALVDSFAVLFETTGDRRWLEAGLRTAHLAATWTMSYDFVFPPTSTFGKLDMLTTGTVWANIQNKHSAPGICTLSGDGLLKLYRASGDARVLHLLRDIAHAIPQYLSRADRPIVDTRVGKRWPIMPDGWMNERVNTSDWEVRDEPWEEIGVGEIFGGSCWCEASMLLTTAELPGIYLRTDTLELTVLDHVHAQLEAMEADRLILAISNPTPFEARVKLLAEDAAAMAKPLGAVALSDVVRITVPAGATVRFPVRR